MGRLTTCWCSWPPAQGEPVEWRGGGRGCRRGGGEGEEGGE